MTHNYTEYQRDFNKGLFVQNFCTVCERAINKDENENEKCVIFWCGHVYHQKCVFIPDMKAKKSLCISCISNFRKIIDLLMQNLNEKTITNFNFDNLISESKKHLEELVY